MSNELKPCPFCGGKGKISFKEYDFAGWNAISQRKIKYRVQVICNRCRSRGKPIITNWLIDPNPYCSEWWLGQSERHNERVKRQTEEFRPYVERAFEAWNRRAE